MVTLAQAVTHHHELQDGLINVTSMHTFETCLRSVFQLLVRGVFATGDRGVCQPFLCCIFVFGCLFIDFKKYKEWGQASRELERTRKGIFEAES